MTRFKPFLCLASAIAAAPLPQAVYAFPSNLQPVVAALEQRGWTVLLQAPPQKGAYGMANSKTKTIWVHPITEAMEIMPHTFVHEAVHAVQSCKTGKMTPIGYKPPLGFAVDRAVFNNLYRNYDTGKWDIEREAFAIQAQPNRVALITQLIAQHCPLPSQQ